MNRLVKLICSNWLVLMPFAVYLVLVILRAAAKMPWCDEAWFASSAVNLVRHGFMGNTLFPVGAGWPGLDQYTFWQPPMYFLAEALTFKIFGIGLVQVHAVSIFWGLAGLVAVYYLAREIFGQNLKLLFVLLLLVGADMWYLIAASDGRMDMMAASLSLVAFALYVVLRKNHLSWAIFLSNLCVCLSGLTHPNGLLGLLVVIFLIVYLDRNRMSVRTALIGFVPYIMGAIGWGAYIAQDFDAFQTQFFGNAIRADTLSWTAIPTELVERYLKSYGVLPLDISLAARITAPILVFFFLGLASAPFLFKEKMYRMAWGMLIIYFLGLMFLSGNKSSAYLVWITPFFLLNSVALWQVARKFKVINIFIILAFIYILLFSVVYARSVSLADAYQNKYLNDLDNFNASHYQGGLIYGSGELAFYYDFDDNIIQDDPGLGYNTGIKPEYFVVEIRYQSWFETFKKDSPEKWAYVDKTISEEYVKVYQGKYYTFYERRP